MKNAFHSFHRAESNFFTMVSFSQHDYGNLVAFATGVQSSGLNPAIVNQVDELFATSLSNCQSFYRKKNLPWALILPEYLYNEPTGKLLQQHNLVFSGDGVAMGLVLLNIQCPTFNSGLKTREMRGDLHDWSLPLIYGFESTPEATEIYTTRHQLASKAGAALYHFSGYINDIIVCSLSLSLCKSNARIDDVATLPVYQKKGYATELIYAALQHAQQLKVDTCFLEASTSGLGLYKRIGFNDLFINHYYEPQSPL